MTAAQTLRDAADKIEQLAEKATHNVCPAWVYSAVRHIARNCDIECYHSDDVDRDGADHGVWSRYDDSPWIAVMGSQIAAPLAAWLRILADAYEQYPADVGDDEVSEPMQLARAILATEPAS